MSEYDLNRVNKLIRWAYYSYFKPDKYPLHDPWGQPMSASQWMVDEFLIKFNSRNFLYSSDGQRVL
jgi:hypothetical protein